nr:unnamed protein product [Digitaria exilis]
MHSLAATEGDERVAVAADLPCVAIGVERGLQPPPQQPDARHHLNPSRLRVASAAEGFRSTRRGLIPGRGGRVKVLGRDRTQAAVIFSWAEIGTREGVTPWVGPH